MFEESSLRSVLKAISWRIVATLTTSVLVYAFTGQPEIAVTVGLLEGITKIFLYFGHERMWNRLNVGRAQIDRHGKDFSESAEKDTQNRPVTPVGIGAKSHN